MRIKVFIADDEIFVLQLIQKIIDWDALNMNIVGTACNGEDAYRGIIELSPDIVIVDVKMPGYDGITLMQKIREQNENVKFVVISGHKRFEYAKSAMQYNVEDYILKPIDKDELTTILNKIKGQIEEETQTIQTNQQIEHRLMDSQRNLQRLYLEEYLQGDLRSELIGIDRVNHDFQTTFVRGVFHFCIVHLNILERDIDQAFQRKMLEMLTHHFLNTLDHLCHCILSLEQENSILFLMNYPVGHSDEIEAHYHTYFAEMNQMLNKFEKLQLNLCIGTVENNLYDAWVSLEWARKAQKSRLALGTNKIILPAMVKTDDGVKHIVFSDNHIQNTQAAIKSFDKNAIRIETAGAFERAREYEMLDTCIYYQTAQTIYQYFYDYVHQIDLYDKTLEEFLHKVMPQLHRCVHAKHIPIRIQKNIRAFIEKYTGEQNAAENPAIRISKRYIAENYGKEITLTSISDIVNLSSVYFSMLFKQEVGINFTEYLNQYRIEQSKQFLKNVSNNIGTVADQVGFSDSRYFTRVFKRYLGITPTEYRQRCIGDE